jgi:hypothetical protein
MIAAFTATTRRRAPTQNGRNVVATDGAFIIQRLERCNGNGTTTTTTTTTTTRRR